MRRFPAISAIFVITLLFFALGLLASDYGFASSDPEYSMWDIIFPIISFVAVIISPCLLAVWVIFKTIRS